MNMRRTLYPVLAAWLGGYLASAPIVATAEDIDIFTGASGGSSVNPRILIVLDNTANWARQNQQWPGGLQQGQSEVRAISNLLPLLDSTVSMGLMEFVTGGDGNDDGGFVRHAVQPLDGDAKNAFTAKLATIYDNIRSSDEKRNSARPYGTLMYDVYNYFAGANSNSPGSVLSSIADGAGYSSPYATFRSPLTADNTCGKSFVVFIGNPNARGPRPDSAANLTALNQLNGNVSSGGAAIPVSQLGLPDFTTQSATIVNNVGTTAACYPSPAEAATAELSSFDSQCSLFTEGCAIGAATAPINPIACPSGSLSYSVVQSVYHPATTTPGQPVQGTVTTQTGTTTGYYDAAASVPGTDHGSLTCPSSTTTTSGSTTTTTTYSCTYTVGSPVGSATPVTSSHLATLDANSRGAGCYTGVGTATGNWNAASTTDYGGLTCPANSSCTYSGVFGSNASGCTGSGYRQVTVTQSATPKRQYGLTMTVTPTSTSNNTTPAYTTQSVLGKTSQCYASAPAKTDDYASSCTGTNISCTYNNTPTSTTLSACPAGTSAYKVDGTNTVMVDTPTGTATTDAATYNADEWSRLLHDRGVPVANSTVRSSVTTYTIDVYNKQPNATHTSLLMSMAKAGGGKYFAATNEQSILDALKQIIIEIQAVNSTFASTSLPVSAANRSQNENQVFIGMFRPDSHAKPRWFGNLKRYKVIADGADVRLGDVNGIIATSNVTGFMTPCATSFWTSDSGSYWSGLGVDPDPAGTCTTAGTNKYSDLPDGSQVEKGGAAEVLRWGNGVGTSPTQALNRTMLTVSNGALVTFNTANTGLSDSLVRFVRGEDVNNEKNGTDLTTTRPSIHGDVIHSRPLPINYGAPTGVRVFYGANDGALHAVDGATGVEHWSLVAPEFYGRLQRLMDNSPLINYPSLGTGITPTPTSKDYFFDGSTGVFQNADNSKVWIYPTMRRGGRMLYALDVTSADSPVLKWKVGCPNLGNDTGCTTGMSGIGQTWSTPNVALIRGYSTTKPVVVVGGGYDACEDADTASPSCGGGKGGIVYVLDADTGAILRSFNTDRAVAADVAMVDTNSDGSPDYAYVADTGGNLYRISFVDTTGSSLSLPPSGWTSRKVAYTNGGGRKFLFAPALLPTRGQVYVALGSGDREHPLLAQYPYANVTNRFYVYVDGLLAQSGSTAVDLDADLPDYTNQDSCSTAQALPNSSLKGWHMDLNQYGKGEQTVTSALITGGMVAFSTNRPIPPDAASCSTPLGEARGYWVNLFNGSGAIGSGATCGGKRSTAFAGGGMPPSPSKANSVDVISNGVTHKTTVVFGTVSLTKLSNDSNDKDAQKPPVPISYKRKRVYKATSGD